MQKNDQQTVVPLSRKVEISAKTVSLFVFSTSEMGLVIIKPLRLFKTTSCSTTAHEIYKAQSNLPFRF